MAYHYTESGLDNVYLVNGYTVHETKYGKGISIHDTEGLHNAIGELLVNAPKPLSGAELRFLRLELELTQRNLAAMLGSEEQTVRRWEKARTKAIPGPADRLLRVLYTEYRQGDGSVRRMIDRLADLDKVEHAEFRLHDTGHGWEPSDRVAA